MALNWEPKDIVKDLLDNNWSLNDVPDVVVSDDENKKMKSTTEPLEIYINQLDPITDRDDVLYQTEDVRIPVVLTIKSHNDDKTTDYWVEARSILLNNRTDGRGLGGEWDKIEIDDNELTDPSYAEHNALIEATFIKNSKKI